MQVSIPCPRKMNQYLNQQHKDKKQIRWNETKYSQKLIAMMTVFYESYKQAMNIYCYAVDDKQ